ncbi:MAG: DsbA family protein, partial [Desulfobacteraceae bacterium]|nr:DsbA family protein [Desulfobacteraceae bacterium]
HQFNPLVKQPYHKGTGALALFSIYAQTLDKFWEANDLFFQLDKSIGSVNSKNVAKKLDLDHRGLVNSLKNQSILYHLQKDIQKGLDLGLTGTPGYVINNEVYQGYIPDHLLKNVLE